MELNDNGRDVSVIFADGAGAVIVSRTDENKGIKSTHLHSEGKYAKELWVESPSSGSRPTIDLEKINQGRHFLQPIGIRAKSTKRFPHHQQQWHAHRPDAR